jgi:hypothetical protein
VGAVREFDTTAAIFILKARRPKVYRDNARIEHTGPGGGPVQVESFREEFIRRIERLAARRGMVGLPAAGGPAAPLPSERDAG